MHNKNKDRQYYSIINNLYNEWNNPCKVPKKVYPYYHLKKEIYKETQPSDTEKLLYTERQTEKQRRELHMIGKAIEHERLKERMAYRKALEATSSQCKRNSYNELDNKSRTIMMNTALKKTYVDPSRNEKMCPVLFKLL